MGALIKIVAKYSELRDRCRYYLLRDKRASLYDRLAEKKLIVLSSDCLGGKLMKDYMLPCYTPTVNIWFTGEDYLKLCEDPQRYFSQELKKGEPDHENHPTGLLDDIVLHFGHEEVFEEGAKKWRLGCRLYERAIKGPHEFCVVMTDRNGFAPELVERFEKLPYRYKVLFTHRPYANAPHTFYMKGEDARECVDTITRFEHVFSLKRRYERFDFYQWFREIYL